MAKPIIIVGAGIAGLAAALALSRRGVESVVLERRDAASDEGAGIQIGPNGTAALAKLGVIEALRSFASAPRAIRVHDGITGSVLTELPLGDWITQRHGSPYWVVRRADLAGVLRDAVAAAGVDVRYGVDVALAVNDSDGVSVDVGGAELRGRGLIGADGLWSSIRRGHFDAAEPVATGRAATRAMLTVADAPAAMRDVVSVWMAPDAHVVAYPVARGEQLNVVLIAHGAELPRAWSTALDQEEATRRAHVFAAPVRELLGKARAWRQWPLLSRAPLQTFSRGRIAVAGDAAHPMLPFLAQGAVMALEDAVALADAVVDMPDDVARAFATYSAARVVRANRVVSAAERNGRIYHLSGLAAATRNASLRAIPATLAMRGYDWLYRTDA